MDRNKFRRRVVALGVALATGLALATSVHATPITITTTGNITTLSDPNGLLGAGKNLTGGTYQLAVEYDDPTGGPNFYSDGSTTASDDVDALAGSITLTVGGHSLTTVLTSSGSTGATLAEDLYDLTSVNAGFDAAGDFVDAQQYISTLNSFVALADLQTNLSYALTASDSDSDYYAYAKGPNSNVPSLVLNGVATSVTLTSPVPEPASSSLMLAALAGLGFIVRSRARRQAGR